MDCCIGLTVRCTNCMGDCMDDDDCMVDGGLGVEDVETLIE